MSVLFTLAIKSTHSTGESTTEMCSATEFFADNAEDADLSHAVAALKPGETHRCGGGAQPDVEILRAPWEEGDDVEVNGEPGTVTTVYYDDQGWALEVLLPVMEQVDPGESTAHVMEIFQREDGSWEDGKEQDVEIAESRYHVGSDGAIYCGLKS